MQTTADHSGHWFKFNDDQVQVMNKSDRTDVMEAQPYILVYKRGLSDDSIDGEDDESPSEKKKEDSSGIKGPTVESS